MLFSISFWCREIYVQNASPNVEAIVRNVLLEQLDKLIKSECRSESEDVLVLNLKKEISINSTEQTLTMLRKAMMRLFVELMNNGWVVATSTCLSQGNAPSTVYFQQSDTKIPEMHTSESMVCLSPYSSSNLQFIGPQRLKETFEGTVEKLYMKNRFKSKAKKGGTVEVKLTGYPWGTKFVEPEEDVTKGRQLILGLIEEFAANTFQFYAKVCFDGKVDSMFFISTKKPVQNVTFFALCLSDPPETLDPNDECDMVQLIGAPQDVVNNVQQHFQCKDILRSIDENTTLLRLNGEPWQEKGWMGALVQASIGELLDKLLTGGWSLVCCSKWSVSPKAMSNFVFQHTGYSSLLSSVCTIAFNRRSSIYILKAPKEVHEIVASTIAKCWSLNMKHYETGPHGEDVLLKLYGEPFDQFADTTTYLMVRNLMNNLMLNLGEVGWQILASAEVSASHNYWPKKKSSLMMESNHKESKYEDHSHTWYLVKK